MRFRMGAVGWVRLILALGVCGAVQAVEPPRYDASEMGVYFRDWLVCGSFPNGARTVGSISIEGYESEGFHQDFLGPIGGEAGADPGLGNSFREATTGREFTWEFLKSDSDLISFENHFEENDNVVAYAFARVDSDSEKEVILSVGSNDGIRVFLNGELVHSHYILRWLGKDSDYVPITLKKGSNRLLIKVDESGGDWGFSARLLDYEETLNALRRDSEKHSKLRVVTREGHLAAFFGEPYQIETLNPGAQVRIDAYDAKGDLTARLSGRCGRELRFPLSTFEDGPVYFKAFFPLPDGTAVESERGHYVGVLPRHEPAARIGKDLAFRDKGEPFFPIGIYSAQPEEYAILKEIGFNFVVAGVDQLDAVQEAGLLASIGFHGDDQAYLDHLCETVEKHKSHPAVLCWMLADEPGYNQMDLLVIHEAYKRVRKIDPNNPTYLVITDPRVYETFGRCCDVLAIDTYPISKKFPINDVGFNIAKAYAQSDGDLPIWHCGQLFAWPSDRLPTPLENRFMTYLALLDGAKGVLWYGMNWYGTSLPKEDPELWKAHSALVRELNDLAPFFIAPGLGTDLVVEDENRVVRANLKETADGRRLVIALNTSQETVTTAEIGISGMEQGEAAVVGEGRTIAVKNGKLTDRFEPLAVHLYLAD